MGAPSRQRRNRRRMTKFNIFKSQQERETQLKIILNLEKEINAQKECQEGKLKHTLDLYEKDYSNLKQENNILKKRK